MNFLINDVAKGGGKGSKKSHSRIAGEKFGKAIKTGVKAVKKFFSRKR